MKAYQVLLPHWLENHVKNRAELLDMSISETLRIQICVAVLSFHHVQFPEYETKMTVKCLSEILRMCLTKTIPRDEIHQLMSEIYYETRKALEYRYKNDKDSNTN